MSRTFATGVIVSAVLGLSVSLLGQSQPDQKPLSFEVVSIKPTNSGVFSDFRIGGEQFNAKNVRLKDLLALAYQFRPDDDRVIGLPDWADNERFDVVAKAPTGTVLTQPNLLMPDGGKPSTVARLVRGLLGDRFHLQIHTDKRNTSGYALVIARGDHQLSRSLVRCNALSNPRSCGVRAPGIQLAGVGMSMSQLATFLSMTLQQPVIDRTQLEGDYDVRLDYSARGFFGPFGRPLPVDENAPSDKPSIFTALEEQLGLKLTSTKEPIEVFVIDHVERPTPD